MLTAAVLRSFTGFGFALAAMPVLSFFLLPETAVVLGASLSCVLGLLSLRHFRHVISIADLVPLVPMSILGTVLGATILLGLPAALFQFAVGVAVLLACVGVTLTPRTVAAGHPVLGWLAGLLSGLFNGALAIPGPPVIVYALLTEHDPVRSRALMMAFFSASALIALLTYSAKGMFHPALAAYIVWSLPALYLGDKLGAYLFSRYGDELYRRIAILTLALLGIAIALRGLAFYFR